MTDGGSNAVPKKPTSEDVSGEAMKEAFRVDHEYNLPDGTHCKMRRLTMTEFVARAPQIARGFAAVDWSALPAEGTNDTGRGYAFMVMLMAASWETVSGIIEVLTGMAVVDDFEIGFVHLDAFLKVHRVLLPTFFSIVQTFGASVPQDQIRSMSGRR
jgi:hypothetical protein